MFPLSTSMVKSFERSTLLLLHNVIQLSLNSGYAQFKSCSRHVGDLRWWGSLTMIPAGNKAKHLSSVNHTTKTIHHHHSLSSRCNYSKYFFCCKKMYGNLEAAKQRLLEVLFLVNKSQHEWREGQTLRDFHIISSWLAYIGWKTTDFLITTHYFLHFTYLAISTITPFSFLWT